MMRPVRMILAAGVVIFLMAVGTADEPGRTIKQLTKTPGRSSNPKIAADGSAAYVVWQEDVFGNGEIYFTKSTDGGLSWGVHQNLTNDAASSLSPAIAVSGSNVYVVWADSAAGSYQINFRASVDGGGIWKAVQVLTKNSTAKTGSPAIAVDGANIYVVWQNDDRDKDGKAVIAFVKSADGGAHWQAVKTLSDPGETTVSLTPAIAVAGAGVFVAWEVDRPASNELFFRRSMSKGDSWQASQRLVTNFNNSPVSPSIAADSSAVYLAWSWDWPGSADISFMKSTDRGESWWQTFSRISETRGRSHAPVVAVHAANVHVVWSDDTPGNFEIYGRASLDGGAKWRAVERLTGNSGSSLAPSLAISGSKVLAVWQDLSRGNYDIYLLRDKEAVEPITVISPAASSYWVMGRTEKIKWRIGADSAGPASRPVPPGISKVNIDLYRGAKLVTPIVSQADAAAGSYVWPVPKGMDEAANYKVRISSSTNGKIFRDSPAFTICRTALADLVLYGPSTWSRYPTTVETIRVSVYVKNEGVVTAGRSTLNLHGTLFFLPALKPGASSAAYSLDLGPLAAGPYDITATADADGAVVEANETNNQRTLSLTVTEPPALTITPSNRDVPWATGVTTFAVSNTGGGTMEWTAEVHVFPSILTITSGSSGTNSGTITVAYAKGANPYQNIGTVRIAAPNAWPVNYKDVSVTQTTCPWLVVGPNDGLISAGTVGGPFSPASKTYTLWNAGGVSLDWAASKTQAWLTLSATNGTLAPGGSVTITVSVNGDANALAAGAYEDYVVFSDLTNGSENTSRRIILAVTAPPAPERPR